MKIPLPSGAALLHDFGITSSRVVLNVGPLNLVPMKMVTGAPPFDYDFSAKQLAFQWSSQSPPVRLEKRYWFVLRFAEAKSLQFLPIFNGVATLPLQNNVLELWNALYNRTHHLKNTHTSNDFYV